MLTGTIVGSVQLISHNYQTLALIEHENRIVSANNNRAVIFQLKNQYPTLTLLDKGDQYLKFILTGEAVLVELAQSSVTSELITLMTTTNPITFNHYEVSVREEDDHSKDRYLSIEYHQSEVYKITASTITEYDYFRSTWSKRGLTLSVRGTPLHLNCDSIQPFSFPVDDAAPPPVISKCAIAL
jgi:hypothetical protein